MAKVVQKRGNRAGNVKRPGRKPRAERSPYRRTLEFAPRNYLLLAAGILIIAAGYILLAQGSITLAPVLLILGYCVIVPIAIIVR